MLYENIKDFPSCLYQYSGQFRLLYDKLHHKHIAHILNPRIKIPFLP